MIGILLISHADFAAALLRAAELIIGPAEKTAAISLTRERSPDDVKVEIQKQLAVLGSDGEGVLVLTDMFGGTPTNMMADFLLSDNVDVLTGMNLPMLLKGLGARKNSNLTGLSEMLAEYARNTIIRPVELLSRSK